MTDEKAIEAAARAAYNASPYIMRGKRVAFPNHETTEWGALEWDDLAQWVRDGMTGFLRAYLAQREADGWVMVNLRHVSVSEGPPMIAAAPGRDDGR